jgi:hypothetical protein
MVQVKNKSHTDARFPGIRRNQRSSFGTCRGYTTIAPQKLSFPANHLDLIGDW